MTSPPGLVLDVLQGEDSFSNKSTNFKTLVRNEPTEFFFLDFYPRVGSC